MIILRDMIESDIEDYVRWFTSKVEWMEYDAPWEGTENLASIEEERKSWTEYYQSIKNLPKEEIRWKYEIEYNGKHVGWVSRYFDLEYIENVDNIPAIGIDIPETDVYNKGIGTEALKMFMEYLKKAGYEHLYIQTWSGNTRMLHIAEKLGFKEFYKKKNHRTVNGKMYDAITLKF